MTSAQIIIVVTIVLYLAAMVFVGVYFGKKGSGSSPDSAPDESGPKKAR